MCGIFGRINNKKKVSQNDLLKMASAIAHRGPDDKGIWINNNISLGQQRLAVIDLSPKGHQPMSDNKKEIWLTFNGEIYNFKSIREKLIKKGHKFNSQSDTEVIINAYKEYGTDCLKYFRGMFAFALFDQRTNTFFAARDRLGKKPFKYFYNGESFIFASEIKSLLTQSEIKPEMDPEAIKQYIYWGFIPSPKTGFKDIYKLPPGHYLLLKNQQLTIKPYWDLKFNINNKRTEKQTIKKLRQTIEEAVKIRLISDVPIGAFLSGGIDSAIIVGLMSKLSPKKINTYTIGFENWEGNELESAAITAKYHKTKHHHFIIKPDLKEVLPKIIAAYDEPFGDVSAIPSYYVSQEAKKHVTVVLNGDGGDENFLGYSNYELFILLKKLHIFSLFAKIIHPVTKIAPAFLNANPFFQKLARSSELIGLSLDESYAKYARGYLNLIKFSDLFNDKSFSEKKELEKFITKNSKNISINDILTMDLKNVLPDGLMTKIDIASMQHGLESRSPLLDQEVVELAATIPENLKYNNKITKYIIKKAFADLIPPEILKLPKRGFVMPVNQWIRKELKTEIEKELLDKRNKIYQMLNFETVKKILKLHQTTNMDYSPIIWKIFILSLWQKKYL